MAFRGEGAFIIEFLGTTYRFQFNFRISVCLIQFLIVCVDILHRLEDLSLDIGSLP